MLRRDLLRPILGLQSFEKAGLLITLLLRRLVPSGGAGSRSRWSCGWTGLCIALVALPLSHSPLAAQEQRPNVVVILSDQQSAAMMSAAGNPYLETPAMDRIARGGTRFERAYVTNPVCSPSRISIMTGQMPSTLGIERNQDARDPVHPRFLKNALGRVFQQAGYETVYGGKTHLASNMDLDNIGFDERLGTVRHRRGKLAEASAKYIKKEHDQPFFLFASFINPHDICYLAINDYRGWQGKDPLREGPFQRFGTDTVNHYLDEAKSAPGDLEAFVEANAPPLPDNFAISRPQPGMLAMRKPVANFKEYPRFHWSETEWRLQRWLYARLTERLDRQVGQLLDAIDEAGLNENTIVLFMSEHGEMDGAHQRVHKGFAYEEATRVPFMLKWEGHLPAGEVDREHLVSVGLDVIPTLTDLTGIGPFSDLPGRSVKPLVEGRTVEGWRPALPIEFVQGRAIRTGRYKYVVYKRGERREQLFDMKQDPGELRNLAYDAKHQNVLNEMRGRLIRWSERVSDELAMEEGYLISPGDEAGAQREN